MGFQDTPTLGVAATKNIGEFYMSYCTEDMYKLNPLVVKQTKEYLEKAVNDVLNVVGLPPMVEKEESDSTSKHPNWSQPYTQEEAYSMSKLSCISNNNSHHSKEERQQQTATFPGIVA